MKPYTSSRPPFQDWPDQALDAVGLNALRNFLENGESVALEQSILVLNTVYGCLNSSTNIVWIFTNAKNLNPANPYVSPNRNPTPNCAHLPKPPTTGKPIQGPGDPHCLKNCGMVWSLGFRVYVHCTNLGNSPGFYTANPIEFSKTPHMRQ